MTSPTSVMTPPNHSFRGLLFLASKQEGQDGGDKEEYRVHNAERPACLQHRTVLVDIGTPLSAVAALSSIIAEDPEVNVDIAG